jgi:hypothetical protein
VRAVSDQGEVIEWCRKNAAVDKEPDEKTVREAIKKHGLDAIGVRGNRPALRGSPNPDHLGAGAREPRQARGNVSPAVPAARVTEPAPAAPEPRSVAAA